MAVFVLFVFSIILPRVPLVLPKPNNTDPPEELISFLYPDEMFDDLLTAWLSPGYTLRDLSQDYVIECVRDPQIWNEHYSKYIVLLSESGRKAIITYGYHRVYGNQKIHTVSIINDVLSKDDMERKIQEIEKNTTIATDDDWYPQLKEYSATGIADKTNLIRSIPVKEGSVIVRFKKCQNYSCQTMLDTNVSVNAYMYADSFFIPDNILFSDQACSYLDPNSFPLGTHLLLLLPVDKQ